MTYPAAKVVNKQNVHIILKQLWMVLLSPCKHVLKKRQKGGMCPNLVLDYLKCDGSQRVQTTTDGT